MIDRQQSTTTTSKVTFNLVCVRDWVSHLVVSKTSGLRHTLPYTRTYACTHTQTNTHRHTHTHTTKENYGIALPRETLQTIRFSSAVVRGLCKSNNVQKSFVFTWRVSSKNIYILHDISSSFSQTRPVRR